MVDNRLTVAVAGHIGVTAAAYVQHVLRLALPKAPRMYVVRVELQLHVFTVAPRRLQVLRLYTRLAFSIKIIRPTSLAARKAASRKAQERVKSPK